MKEICPVCGSRYIKALDVKGKKYVCTSCDATFTLEDTKAVQVPHSAVEKAPVLPRDTTSAKTIYNKNICSIIEVTATFGEDEFSGTGFYVSAEYAITNAHVVISTKIGRPVLCDEVYVCKSRAVDFYDAEVVFLDAKNDLALLRVDGADSHTVVSFSRVDVEVGDRVFVIGNSLGDGLTLLDGMVGDVGRQFKSATTFLFNALVTHGCSGGPVFNDKGEVCGVTIGGTETAAGMNYALPVSALSGFISRAKKEKGIVI